MTIRSVKIILVCNTDFFRKMVKNGLYFIKVSNFWKDQTNFRLAMIMMNSMVISLPPLDLRKWDSLDYIPLWCQLSKYWATIFEIVLLFLAVWCRLWRIRILVHIFKKAVCIWSVICEKVVCIWSVIQTFYSTDQSCHHCFWAIFLPFGAFFGVGVRFKNVFEIY